MYSFNFPNMFDSRESNLIEDHEATKSNLRLLLYSWKKSLLGDPAFGSNLKRFIYDQNSIILKDLVIDDVCSCVKTFMPQVYLTRDNVKVTTDRDKISITMNCLNKLDNTNDLLTISLTSDEIS